MKGKRPPPVTFRGGAKGAKGAENAQAAPGQQTPVTPKEQLKLAKVNRQWRLTMDFLFRQLATTTYQFNVFFTKDLTTFAKAMSDGDDLRSQLKLKKSDKPRIWNRKTMLEAADLLSAAQQIEEADHLRALANLSGRTRAWGLMAAELQRLATGKSEKMKALLETIRGFTNRTVDYSVMKYAYNVDMSEFTELEKTYLTWLVAVRTALLAGAQLMKLASDVSGTPLLQQTDPTYLLHNMQPAEFVLALNMDAALNDRTTEEEKQKTTILGPSVATKVTKKETWKRPNVASVDPELLRPIDPKSLLLQLSAIEAPAYQPKKNEDRRRR